MTAPSQPLSHHFEQLEAAMVKAKFYVSEKTEFASNGTRIKLSPVSRGEENKEWSKYTPSGSIELMCLNDAASAEFVVGQEYSISFERAEQA